MPRTVPEIHSRRLDGTENRQEAQVRRLARKQIVEMVLEVKNLYADPAYADTVKELHAELDRLWKEVEETEEPPRAAYGNRPLDGQR